MAFASQSVSSPPLIPVNSVNFALPSSLSPHHTSQIHARILRLNLTSHSPPFQLLHFHNSLIQSFTSLSLHNLSFSLFLSLLETHSLEPDHYTFPFILKSSTLTDSLFLGKQIHAYLIKSNIFYTNVFCASALLDFYVKLGYLNDAVNVFERMSERSVETWNSMILGFVGHGFIDKGLEMLDLMEHLDLDVGVSSWNSIMAGCVKFGDADVAVKVFGEMARLMRPDPASFNTILSVISEVKSLNWVKELHGFAIRNMGIVNVGAIDEERFMSAIAAGYACHGLMDYAEKLFDSIKLKNSHLGNSMISGFLNCKQIEKAFGSFREMAYECIRKAKVLSKISLTLHLPECGVEFKTGLEIHAYAIRRGLESDNSVGNALMAMYSKRGEKESVEKVFERTIDRDIVSWNTIIASYASNHEFDRAFKLFQNMLEMGLKPDEYSFSSVLNGCGYSSYLWQAMSVHAHMIKSGFAQSYPIVQNSLMDAYGKCGCVEDACKVFDDMEWRDNISWNTVISCYGFSANPCEAISSFEKMMDQGWKPNRVTYIALLSACSHAGYLDKGLHYFETMEKVHGIVPDLGHYTCIVDSMGRLGQLERAYRFIKDMPIEPNDCIWSALLSGCRTYGNIELAEVAAMKLIELKPNHSGYWVLLSNIYANASRWKDVAKLRGYMKDSGVTKSPGYSWIETKGSEIHRFLNGDKLHTKCDEIYLVLDGLTDQVKDEGYIPVF